MILPARRRPVRQPAQLCPTARRGRQRIVNDRRPPAWTIERVEKFSHVTAVLSQCGEIAAQGWNPERQRFNQRKPEPFGKGWKQQSPRSLDEPRQLSIRQIAVFEDDAPQCRTAFQHVDCIFGFPPALADQNQPWHGITEFVNQLAPKIQQQQMVLTGLDGANANKVRWLYER